MPGIAARLLNEVAMNNINIIENISCFPEMIFIFEEKQMPKAYNVLHNITIKQ